MSLTQWLDNGWLVRHSTTRQEVSRLLAVARRDLDVASGTENADWKFGVAYNSALKLCTVLLYAAGYRPARDAHHFRTLQSLPLILGASRDVDADYLDQCRRKRNELEYVRVDVVSPRDAEELLGFCRELLDAVQVCCSHKTAGAVSRSGLPLLLRRATLRHIVTSRNRR